VGLGGASVDRRKRSRVFIDPLTEIPRLERWFADDTHPSAYTIEQYTDQLNRAAYRQRFPPLEPKNVQLWFKNHRAKDKRHKLEPRTTEPKSSGRNWNPEPPRQGQAPEARTAVDGDHVRTSPGAHRMHRSLTDVRHLPLPDTCPPPKKTTAAANARHLSPDLTQTTTQS